MQTKAFYTAITTDCAEKTISFYVGLLGFHVAHILDGGEGMITVLENDRGAKIDVISTPGIPGGLHALRTNVDDLDAALAECQAQGCEIVAGPVELTTGKAIVIRDPNGVLIDITQHIRK